MTPLPVSTIPTVTTAFPFAFKALAFAMERLVISGAVESPAALAVSAPAKQKKAMHKATIQLRLIALTFILSPFITIRLLLPYDSCESKVM